MNKIKKISLIVTATLISVPAVTIPLMSYKHCNTGMQNIEEGKFDISQKNSIVKAEVKNDSDGWATVTISGLGKINKKKLNDLLYSCPYGEYRVKQIFIKDGVLLPDDCSYLFENAKGAKISIYTDINTENVTNTSYMFEEMDLENVDFSNWNVSNVSDFSGMFMWTKNTNLDLSKWDFNKALNINNPKKDFNLFNRFINIFNNIKGSLKITGSFIKKLYNIEHEQIYIDSIIQFGQPNPENKPSAFFEMDTNNNYLYISTFNKNPSKDIIEALDDNKIYLLKYIQNDYPSSKIDSLEYLNKSQKNYLNTELHSQTTLNDSNIIRNNANNLNLKMKKLINVSNANLDSIVKSKNPKISKEAKDLQTKINLALKKDNDSSQANISESKIDEYITKINSLTKQNKTFKAKQHYQSLLIVNIIIIVASIALTAVVIKKYKK